MKTTKLMAALLAVIMLITLLLPVGVYAEDERGASISNARVIYKIKEDGTIEITKISVTAQRYTVDIPGEIDGKRVTSIGDYAAWDEETSNKEYYLTLPEGLESIGDYAFRNSYYAVGNGTRVFGSLPSTLKHIGNYAFEGIGFKETVNIPDSLTEMTELAFYNTFVHAFTVGQNNPVFASIDGVLFRKQDRTLLCYPGGPDDRAYTIPDGIHVIAPYAFMGNSDLYHIEFPDSLQKIEPCAFLDCRKLSAANIPGSVAEIGDSAFRGCNIQDLTLNSGLKRIGARAFSGNNDLREVMFPDTLIEIGDYAFEHTRLTAYDIPANVQSIGKNPFYPCSTHVRFTVAEGNTRFTVYQNSLYDISAMRLIAVESSSYISPLFEGDYTVPEGISVIGGNAFNYIYISGNVSLPDTVQTIEEGAFSNCTIVGELILPKGITAIPDNAFYFASIGYLEIPEGVKSIGKKALQCGNSKLSLPASLTEMADDALGESRKEPVIVPQNSYAEQFCIDHSIPYIYPNSTDWLNP